MEAGRIRALIIEDNQDITANLYAFLEPLGYELDCSANGHIGLEMAVAGTFDVIVLDIMLPGMDGLAVCRALREDHVARGGGRPAASYVGKTLTLIPQPTAQPGAGCPCV